MIESNKEKISELERNLQESANASKEEKAKAKAELEKAQLNLVKAEKDRNDIWYRLITSIDELEKSQLENEELTAQLVEAKRLIEVKKNEISNLLGIKAKLLDVKNLLTMEKNKNKELSDQNAALTGILQNQIAKDIKPFLNSSRNQLFSNDMP